MKRPGSITCVVMNATIAPSVSPATPPLLSTDAPLLSTDEKAGFVSRGFLRFDAVVPPEINAQAMEELPLLFRSWVQEFRAITATKPDGITEPEVPLPRSGTALANAYAPGSALGKMVRVKWWIFRDR